MKKKILLLTLATAMVFSAIGCGVQEEVVENVEVVEEIEDIIGEPVEVELNTEINNYSAFYRNDGDTINYIDESELTDTQICIYINNFATIFDLASDNLYFNTTQLTTEMENTVYVQDAKGYTITMSEAPLPEGGYTELHLYKLNADNNVEFKFTKENEEGKIEETVTHLNALHTEVNFTVEGESTSDQLYYFDYNDAAVKTNNAGEVVFYKYTDFIRDFRRNEIDGEVYYSYLERATVGDYDNIDVTGCAHMRLIILNENYEAIDRVDYLLTDNGYIENHSIENHEYQMYALGHYIVTSYSAMEVDNIPEELTLDGSTTGKVAAAVFQEIIEGELVFEFNSTNYPELYEYSADRNIFGEEEHQDYIHMNSVIIDPSDNNYILSLRSLDSIVKIDSQTSEIVWVLGGKGDMFGISDKYQFSRQHFATISELGTLTLYDNGVTSEQSRVLEFELDEENLEIINVDIYQLDGYFGDIRGAVLRMSTTEDLFLISLGHTQENKAIITEYNFTTDEKVIEFYDQTERNSRNYRSRKYDQ